MRDKTERKGREEAKGVQGIGKRCAMSVGNRDGSKYLCPFGVHGLLKRDAELLAYWLQLLQVLVVLSLVLDLVLDAYLGG